MKRLTFNRKPMPIYPEHRPLYKISQILLALEFSSRSGKCSFLKLQLLNWAVKEDRRMNQIENAADTGKLNISVWGIDPALNAAIQFGIAERLMENDGRSIMTTTKGKAYIDSILEREILREEKQFYSRIGKRITEKMVSSVVESWG